MTVQMSSRTGATLAAFAAAGAVFLVAEWFIDLDFWSVIASYVAVSAAAGAAAWVHGRTS